MNRIEEDVYVSYSNISHAFLGMTAVFTIAYIDNKSQIIKKISSLKVCKFIETYSLYIYIVHYFFLEDDLVCVYGLTNSIVIDTLLFIAATALSSLLLRWIYMKILKFVEAYR